MLIISFFVARATKALNAHVACPADSSRGNESQAAFEWSQQFLQIL
jgi:hypothetical protein